MKKTHLLFVLVASLVIGMAGCTTSGSQPTANAKTHKAQAAFICAYEGAPPSAEGIQVTWSKTEPQPQIIFGNPVYKKHDDKHNIIRPYFAFTVYYDDVVLSPRWTAIKITKEIADKNKDIERLTRFKVDETLKQKGYQTTTHDDYKNPTGMKKWARGHMVQFDDARGYGRQAAEDSFYTTNICPQLAALNGQGWLALEKLCTEYARDYAVVWIYTGPIYKEIKPFAPDRKIPSPTSFYKIVVSPGEDGGVDVLAFIVPHKPLKSNADLSKFLVSIDEVEKQTKLDFLPDLPDNYENYLEKTVWELWPDLEN
jgi:endonuclease G, mitochondrial